MQITLQTLLAIPPLSEIPAMLLIQANSRVYSQKSQDNISWQVKLELNTHTQKLNNSAYTTVIKKTLIIKKSDLHD